ncbi:AMP-binding protein [Micromonospora sp. 4G55]|uniref:AMP-binding protein n=1 Tax=Micromonospora sp. 4G55 TaxID=2806102 RepID=UPI00278BD39D|nr:AMP-binding protein [Micromonospora sp. 4G55]
MVDVDGPALSARFLRGLAANPTGTALRVGSRAVSYAELHELALARAGALRAAGDQPPEAVAVLTGKSVEAYAGILAVLYAGATVVPLHAGFPVARTRRMLEVSGATAVVADEAGLATLGELAGAGLELPVLAPGLDATRCPARRGSRWATGPSTRRCRSPHRRWPTCCSPPAPPAGPRACRSPTA